MNAWRSMSIVLATLNAMIFVANVRNQPDWISIVQLVAVSLNLFVGLWQGLKATP